MLFLSFEMGCLYTKNVKNEVLNKNLLTKKTYSWDEKKKLALNSKNHIIENLYDQEEIRTPGSIDGEQFIIQNCENTTIYILDFTNTITVNDCINCKIILGPIAGSAYIGNCSSCTFVIASGQFRMRDCIKINVFLFCATQPVIEASRSIYFGSYQLHYIGIEDHFKKANLNLVNNYWKDVYDFTPMNYQTNWNFMQNDNIIEYISQPKLNVVKKELKKYGLHWTSISRPFGDDVSHLKFFNNNSAI